MPRALPKGDPPKLVDDPAALILTRLAIGTAVQGATWKATCAKGPSGFETRTFPIAPRARPR